MSADLQVVVSAQIAMQQRMETVAHNVANINTAGFRAEGIKFETVLSSQTGGSLDLASTGETYITRRSGPIAQTGNPLDVAIDGEGWFAFQTPEGRVYSRDGRFHLDDAGQLLTVNDYAVLDPGGAPIVVDPAGGPLTISEGGLISQDGGEIGGVGVFLIPEDAALRRYDNAAVVTDADVGPVVDSTASAVRQGYVEGSNVNPVLEITRMIDVSRAYDSAVAAMDNSDDVVKSTIQALGPT